MSCGPVDRELVELNVLYRPRVLRSAEGVRSLLLNSPCERLAYEGLSPRSKINVDEPPRVSCGPTDREEVE